jgi:hypothetical protein
MTGSVVGSRYADGRMVVPGQRFRRDHKGATGRMMIPGDERKGRRPVLRHPQLRGHQGRRLLLRSEPDRPSPARLRHGERLMTMEPTTRAARLPIRRLGGRTIRESRAVGFLRWLGWLPRFRQWVHALVSGISAGLRGAKAQDATTTPSYYRQLLGGPTSRPAAADQVRGSFAREASAIGAFRAWRPAP